jgi:hypothetical protein
MPFANFVFYYVMEGARGIIVVRALCQKPERLGFDSRWGDFFKFN